MKVKMYYENGHIDVFDTDSHTDRVFKHNVVTNYALSVQDRKGQELWLVVYYQEVSDAFRGDIGPAGVPISHRRDGWTVLLADRDDLPRLRRIVVDGETVLVRVMGELVDAQALEHAADVADYYVPRVTGLYDYYLKALGREEGRSVDEEVCALLGVSPDVVRGLMAYQEANRDREALA